MFCRYCGKELPADSNFCPNCGAKQKEEINNYRESTIDFNNWWIVQYVKSHKAISYTYLTWFLLHLTLYISSSKPEYCDKRFYPYDNRFSEVISGGYYDVDFLGNTLNYYDFTEFFAYILILPLFVLGIYKLFVFLKKKYFNRKLTHKQNTDRQRNSDINKEQRHSSTIVSCDLKSDNAERISHSIIRESEGKKKLLLENVSRNQTNSSSDNIEEKKSDEKSTITDEVKKMPIFRRLTGSIIDKIILLILFVIGSVVISPYGAPGNLGKYIGLRNTPIETYEYIDRINMNNYGTYSEGVSQYYQDRAMLSNGTPHIGSTLELDMSITFSFIILNMLYYLIFEATIGGSVGKRLLGGIIYDNADERIGFVKAFVRCLCFGFLMAGIYYSLHLQIGLSNSIVVCVFFVLLDLPVIFTKKSLLDIMSGTKYTKVN